MGEYNIFDILGPVMIGPSSSHTAGACRIAKTALMIAGNKFKKLSLIFTDHLQKLTRVTVLTELC